MTQHSGNPQRDESLTGTDYISACPVCDGQMETVYNRGHQQVLVCLDCRADLTIPTTAWGVLKRKNQRSA